MGQRKSRAGKVGQREKSGVKSWARKVGQRKSGAKSGMRKVGQENGVQEK